jgi:hypothetical protein
MEVSHPHAFKVQVESLLLAEDVVDVLSTAVESGYPWWYKFEFVTPGVVDGYWWERMKANPQAASIRVTYEDPETVGDGTRIFFLFEFAQAWAECYPVSDPGDIDSDMADCILQHLLFGEVVYG